jgi:hypothetical protein
MTTFKQALKQQFGCKKSFFKVHNFAYVIKENNRYGTQELCLNCRQPRT